MKFILDAGQRLFGETLNKLLTGADTPTAIREWAAGRPEAGLGLWRSLAGAGLFAVATPEDAGGAGLLPVELATAFHELGRHGVPGPYVETVAAAVLLAGLSGDSPPAEWLARIADGSAVVTLALPPAVPYALDADAADLALILNGTQLSTGVPRTAHTSLDPARRLFTLTDAGEPAAGTAGSVGDAGLAMDVAAAAYDVGVLACAAQLTGLGRRLLEITVEYAKNRQQFGRPIGGFQAVKHHLADALVGLEYARPLVHGAAVSYGTPDFPRDVSAAKAAASEAAYAAARTALQLHGAIGYTDEYSPSLLIRKARALRSAWGTPSAHRARVLSYLTPA